MRKVIDQFIGEYRFLSNFWEVGRSEQRYQAAKCKLGDPLKGEILASSSGKSRRLGRKIELREDWDNVKLAVMMKCLRDKFHWTRVPGTKEDPYHLLAQQLVDTGDAILIEGNTWHDNFWGNCQCGRDECLGTGKNWLGRLLMLRRSELMLDKPESEET